MNQTPTDKCPRCGTARTSGHKFCPQCGANYDAIERVKKVRPEKETIRRRRWEIAGLLGVVILVAIAYNVFVSAKKHTEPAIVPPQQQPTLQSTNTPVGNTFDEIVKSGHTFMDNGQYPAAISQYERALAIDSLQPDVIVDLGACYHGVGDNEEARFQFQRALAMQPRHPVATYNMGVVAMTVADTAEARLWWNKYLEIAPQSPQADAIRERLKSM